MGIRCWCRRSCWGSPRRRTLGVDVSPYRLSVDSQLPRHPSNGHPLKIGLLHRLRNDRARHSGFPALSTTVVATSTVFFAVFASGPTLAAGVATLSLGDALTCCGAVRISAVSVLGVPSCSQRLSPQRVWSPRPAQTGTPLPSAFCKSSFHPFREVSEVIRTIAMKCRRNMSSAAWTGQ